MSPEPRSSARFTGPVAQNRAQADEFPSDPDAIDALLAESLAGFEDDLRTEYIAAGQRYFIEADDAGALTFRDVHTDEVLTREQYLKRCASLPGDASQSSSTQK